jgi:hypothetical protein
MKTIPPGILKVVALVGLGLVTIVAWHALAQSPAPNTNRADKFTLRIHTHTGKYHELKTSDCQNEDDFIQLLNNGHYVRDNPPLHFKRGGSSHVECDLPGHCDPCSKSPSPGQANIKTDKVTVASTAQNVTDGDPHTTQQVVCKTIADVKALLDKLADP